MRFRSDWLSPTAIKVWLASETVRQADRSPFTSHRGRGSDTMTSKQTAEHVWEPKFLAEIVAGRDPHVPPSIPKTAVGLTVAEFLELYFTNYVEAEGLPIRSP